MKRFIEGESRSQISLLPECIDDFVGDDNPVRVIEAFVDTLNLEQLGFKGITPCKTGRPSYHPSVIIKLYIYGYLNRIQSSRRLEKETHRNLELMWLLGRLTPDFKTIANFRKDNGKAIGKVCSEFVQLCRKVGLLSQSLVAIDGSKFKAVNNRDKNFTPSKVIRRVQELERSIERYLGRLDKADHKTADVVSVQTTDLKAKIKSLKVQLQRVQVLEADVQAAPDKQVSLTDPDARSLRSRGSGMVGYNVQAAVEAKHHLIVAHEVTNKFSDRGLLYATAIKAKAAMDVDELEAVADRGYYKSEQIKRCDDAGIKVSLPKPNTSGNKAMGRYERDDFIYIPDDDEYRCPAGDRLIWRYASQQDGLTLNRYWSSNCQTCQLKSQCTPSKQRRVSRWEHESILEAVQDRLDRDPTKMRIRRNTIEHTFGTLKSWMGAEHFLTKTIENVSTEMSLHVLAYNLKRAINIIGIDGLIKAIRAFFISILTVTVVLRSKVNVYNSHSVE